MTRERITWLSVSAVALACAHCSPTTNLPPPGIKGQLLYEGKAYALDRPLDIVAIRCREPDQTSIDVQIRIPASDSPYKDIPLKILGIGGDPTKLALGERFVPQTFADRYNPDLKREGQARALGWLSAAGQIGQAGLPEKAWVRFDRLSRMGPVDVSFDLDFGALGRAQGRVVVAETREETCVIPAPPPPPPPPPPR
jgi:hypothetical protein